MNRIFRNTIFYLLIFLVIIGVVSFFNGSNQPTEHIKYDEFISELEQGNVTNFTLQPERGVFEIRGQLQGYEEGKYFLTYVWNSEAQLAELRDAAAQADIEVADSVLAE